MFELPSDLTDTKNNEKACAGELKTIRKRFSMGYLTILIQIKVIYYQEMKAKTIFGLGQASYYYDNDDYDNQAPLPQKRAEKY